MKRDRRELSIRSRLVLATALLLGAATAAPALILPGRLEADARAELESRGLDIARAFATATEVALDFDDRQRAAEVLRGLASAGGVTYGLLLRSDGKPLASWGRQPEEPPPAPAERPSASYAGEALHVRVPVVTPSGERGALHIGLDLESLHLRRRGARSLVVWTALTVFAFGVAALFLIATLLTKPVRTLTALAERIARGDEGAARHLETERGDETGAVAAALGSVIDRLAAQRAMLRSQSEATSEGILTLDLEGKVITHNRHFREAWGLRGAAVEGATWSDLRPHLEGALPAPLPGWMLAGAPSLPGGQPQSFDLALADGRTLAVHAAQVRKPDGEPLGIGLYFRDVTRSVADRRRIEELAEGLERRVAQRTRELAEANEELGRRLSELNRTQEQLVIADRRISLGRLAAGVAHEINNPLAYLVGNVDFVRAELSGVRAALRSPDAAVRSAAGGPLDEVLEALGDAADGAGRVAQIVRGLKAFSRGDDDRREPVQLARAMKAALDMAAHEIRHRARLVQEIRDAPSVEANEVRLSQVLLNLLINAAQAIAPGASDRNAITAVVGTDARGWATAEVRDTGCGISAEIRGRIFDPFFTTKSQGEGTGLGLSISQGIVESFGGVIEVESEPGRGSTFVVRLPPAGRPAAPTKSPAPVAPPPASRVLVVDDEPLVAHAMRRLLARDHEVITVHGGAEALERVRSGERFDVILCDLMMPTMTGMDFHAELAALSPEQARVVIFMSGGAFTEAAEAFVERNRDRFVSKPVDLAELRRVIHAQTMH